MAVFFLLVGLEVKRELMQGSLASLRQAAFPVIRRYWWDDCAGITSIWPLTMPIRLPAKGGRSRRLLTLPLHLVCWRCWEVVFR